MGQPTPRWKFSTGVFPNSLWKWEMGNGQPVQEEKRNFAKVFHEEVDIQEDYLSSIVTN